MSKLKKFLVNTLWANYLTEDEYNLILSKSNIRKHKEGSYIFHEGDIVDHWIGVIEGIVKLGSISKNGKVVAFTYVSDGGWFGEGSLLKQEPRKYDAVALIDTEIACIPIDLFMSILDKNISFNRYLIDQINERLGQLITMLESERTSNPEVRVSECLSLLYNKQLYPSTDVQLNISQEEIAQLCGLSRQHVNGALHSLEKRGWLKVNFGSVTIIEIGKLKKIAD